jgi:hypothetical protein
MNLMKDVELPMGEQYTMHAHAPKATPGRQRAEQHSKDFARTVSSNQAAFHHGQVTADCPNADDLHVEM